MQTRMWNACIVTPYQDNAEVVFTYEDMRV